MGHWIKYYYDGQMYFGDDKAIQEKKASWTLSKNDGIIKVELVHQLYKISIQGTGEYWQSDTAEVEIGDYTQPKVIQRRIEKKIEPHEYYLYYKESPNQVEVCFPSCDKDLSGYKIQRLENVVGKWFILEIDLKTRQIRHYIRSEKI